MKFYKEELLYLAASMARDLKGYVIDAEETGCGDGCGAQRTKQLISRFEEMTQIKVKADSEEHHPSEKLPLGLKRL